jgi:hypothetical protein
VTLTLEVEAVVEDAVAAADAVLSHGPKHDLKCERVCARVSDGGVSDGESLCERGQMGAPGSEAK